MSSTVEEPSQAERLEDVAVAGVGADDKESVGDPLSETAPNGSVERPSNGSDEVMEAKEDAAVEEKPPIPPQAPERSKGKVALIMGSLMIAVFLAALDTTIITTAVPTITAHFHSSEADYTWIGSAYLLAAAAATPTWGKISDIWGRKPIILVANAVFFVGSLISALSINVQMLLAGRVIQGTGGGGLIILANICISDLFSMRDRGKYFGMIGAVWGIASAVGPILGGIFTEKVSWRWCFYINLPFDGIAFAIIVIFLDIETPKTPILDGLKAIDWLGVILVTGGTVMFLLGLEYGGVSFPWSSATVVCLLVFGVVTIVLFFINEWKVAKYPMMPLHLFSKLSNLAALGVCFVHGMVFISGAYFFPLYFQAVLGANPILSGVYLFPFVISLSFTSAFVGIFIKKTGHYLPPIWLGLFFMTVGFGLYIDLPVGRTWGRIFPFQIIAGIGVGPNFQAPLIALQTLVPPRDIATATATFGFIRNLSTSISVVIGGVIFQNAMKKRESTLIAATNQQIGSALGGGGAGAATSVVKSLPEPGRHTVRATYVASLREMWIFYVCVAVVGLALSLFIKKKTLSRTHEVTKTGLAAEEHNRMERKQEAESKKASKRASGMNGRKSGDFTGATGTATTQITDAEKTNGDNNV
ncbi:hypothetical protein HO173_012824 [Letharia columbiana]|uniref:Efflux pump dotC n=1 Tax=Letharia columbiana TaxID=112416 RepID=A0A8H6CLB3_9LECA|nr:uncharacterized protein HO173_012824 [Letharia columbiana]KAF6225339.1 hypothetical protein HO173_012824 [Letharia columbiana]